jgi:Family of unknown function (DUF6056)
MLARLAVLVKRGAILVVAVVAALWVHLVALAWLSPIAGDDWRPLLDPAGLSSGTLVHAALCRVPILHVVATPLVAIALVVGIAALALRRIPLRRGEDALALLVTSALLWMLAPRAGLVFSHRATAVSELYATCAAVWLVLGYARASGWLPGPRHGVRRAIAPGAAALGMFGAGVVAASFSRHIGTALLLAIAWHLARARPRAAWAWTGLGGVAVGTVLIWYAAPPLDLDVTAGRGITAYLHSVSFALRVPAIVIAALVLVALVDLARGRIVAFDRTAAGPILVAHGVPVAITILAIAELSPAVTPAQQFAAVAIAAIVACRVIIDRTEDRTGLVRGNRARAVVAAAAIASQLWIARASIHVLCEADHDATARFAQLAQAPAGSIVTLPLYHRNRQGEYAFGEDLRVAELRDRIAARRFGLRAITLEPAPHGYEQSSPIEYQAITDGPPSATLCLPRWYAADLVAAREQLAAALACARAAGLGDLTLRAVGLAVEGRAVEAAWLEGGALAGIRIAAHGLPPQGTDVLGRVHLRVPEAREIWAIDLATHVAQRLAREGDDAVLERAHQVSYALVACDARRCALGGVKFLE